MRSVARWIAVCAVCITALGVGCSDTSGDTDYDAGKTDARGDAKKGWEAGSGLPDSYGPLYSCKTPGQRCNAHNPCAINPICGQDNKCRPTSVMNCDDGLDCTVDSCLGMGVCKNTPKAGYCAVPVREWELGLVSDAGPGDAGTFDAGTGSTVVTCVTKDTRRPADPCLKCDPDTDKLKWSPANGGYCDDQDSCTKNDTCSEGICKGTYYGNQCADSYGCTTDYCDGKGGCLGHKLKSDWCLISNTCYKDAQKHPQGTCFKCSVKDSQSAWTPITNSCQMDNKCWDKGDLHPLKCAECDPTASTTSWTVKGTTACLINNTCYKAGAKDAIGCAQCDPTSNKYGWTPLSGVCKIFGKCYQKGDKIPGGCAECDPSVSTTAWTVKGNECLINNVCYMPGDKDPINCAQCAPSSNRYDWTPLTGMCKIGGQCYKQGDKHPGGCAQCDTSKSSSSWTVTTNECLVYNVCRKPGDKDLSGCASCDPTKSKYAWSALPGVCKIDGQCFQSGANHPKSCGTCDPTKSASDWTASSGKCVIDGDCYSSGSKHPSGCGSCVPSSAPNAWTVSGSSCIVGDKCFSQGTKEAGGCGICDPTVSTNGWSKPTGCLASHAWSRGFGGSSSDYPYGVAVDGNGNVYVTGYFYNTVDFGGGPMTSKGSYDIFLVSYTPSGKYRWAKTFGSSSSDYGYGVAVDGNGNVYLTGAFYYSVNFGGSTLTSKGSRDIFLASYTSDGTHRWSKSFGSSSTDYGYALATDASGNVYVTGYFYSSANFGGGTVTSNGSYDAFVASYGSTGTYRWAKAFGGSSSDYGYGIAADSSGNVYVTGYFYNTVNFGGGNISSKGSGDVFLVSLNTAGAHRWSKGFGSTSSDYGYDVATDPSGNVIITGSYYNSANFGGGTLTSKGSRDIFVASFSPSGSHRWSKNFGSTSSDYGYGVAADASGNVYLTGYFYNTVNFGGGNVTSKGSYDVFALSLDSSGSYRWVRTHGGTSSDYGRRVAVDPAGDVYFAGSYYYSVDFGGGALANKGSIDAYLLKVDQ